MVKRIQCEIDEQIGIFRFLLTLVVGLNQEAMRGEESSLVVRCSDNGDLDRHAQD